MLYGNNESITHIVDRFLGLDVAAVESTYMHFHDYKNAIDAILRSPFWGVALGSDFEDRIITDGTWFQYALDMGLILFLVYVFMWMIIFFYLFFMIIKCKDKFLWRLAVIVFCIFSYLLLANFLNSSFLAKTNSTITFILLGILLFYKSKLFKTEKV